MELKNKERWTNKWSSILSRRKTTEFVELEGDTKLARVLGLLELTALGVGSTLGIGVYVLAGDVAVNNAGPAVTISFLIAAIASAFAGLCYAEFASRVPRAGSAYIYSYVTIGEFCAFIIGWNLILEYAIGTASVAKGLSNYLDILFDNVMQKTLTNWMPIHVSFLSSYPDFFASGLVILLSVLVAWGVKESSTINGIFTIVNLLTIFIIIVCGAFKANASYWFIPKEDIPSNVHGGEGRFLPFGWAGVMAGAAKCFFGFVGFDVIATTGEEAKNPKKNIPLAIVVSLLIIFIAYFGVASVITMIIPYYEQNENAPLPFAFSKAGLPGVMWIISIGAICALLASLLTVVFPLTRILYAMATDGVLFKFLANVSDKTKTPVVATMLSGILSAIVAGIFNLGQLIDMMSIGTLLAYSIVAFCILFLRYEEDTESLKQSSALFQNGVERNTVSVNPIFHQLKIMFNLTGMKYPSLSTEKTAKRSIYSFCILASVLCFSFIYLENFIINKNICMYLNIILIILTILSFIVLARQPQSNVMIPFKVPFVPLIPCCSILMNIYLMMKLDLSTWIRFILWLIVGLLIYVFYSIDHSVQGKKMLNDEQHHQKQRINE
ncbi:hypothetical protein PGB90_009174 [Kerria lacca]